MSGPGGGGPGDRPGRLGDPGAAERPAGARLGNPLRSEDAAFRWLLVVAGVCLLLVAVVVLARAL